MELPNTPPDASDQPVVIQTAWLSNEAPELRRAWDTFDDPVELNYEEAWQYMGSSLKGGKWGHCFRHRMHPTTDDRVYRRVDAPSDWKPSESETRTEEIDEMPF